MIDSDELLSKADALLARWRTGIAVPRPPADYPVLTEVVTISPANGDAPMPEIPAETEIPVLDVSSAVVGAATSTEIPVIESHDTFALDSLSVVAITDPALVVLETPDDLPHLPPLEVSPAPADVQKLEERVRSRVLEAIEPLVGAFLEEPLRLRVEQLARHLATTIARDVRNDILALVRDAVKQAVAQELEARRDE